jgi:hypothetical protein
LYELLVFPPENFFCGLAFNLTGFVLYSGFNSNEYPFTFVGFPYIVSVSLDVPIVLKTGRVNSSHLGLPFLQTKVLLSNPDEVAPYKYMKDCVMAVEAVVEEKIKLFSNL